MIFSFFIILMWNPLGKGIGTALSWFPVTGLLVIVGLLYFFGRPEPKKIATILAAGVPLLVVNVFGAEPLIRTGKSEAGLSVLLRSLPIKSKNNPIIFF
ncbi:MAG: hypothetical protein ACOC6P_01485 [Candidatus Aminicenantaceae bacterium]